MMYVITQRKNRKCTECPFYKSYKLKSGNVTMGCMAQTPKEAMEQPKDCPLA